MKLKVLLILTLLVHTTYCLGSMKWFNPATYDKPCIQQRGFQAEMKNSYYRFPDRLKDSLPPAVWDLSKNSSGLGIYFYTNSAEIQVRYQVTGPYAQPDMAAIGTSGCDLRYIDKDGIWHDLGMGYSFGDTIQLSYRLLDTTLQHEYRLFLPLYNTVKWLEIGVQDDASFKVATPREEKPIVVYGTSICQGGDTSRAGNSWTNLLSQYLDYPVVNFGFDGRGKMEPEVVKAIGEVDACVYLLDNYYNLTEFPVEEKIKRTIRSVQLLRNAHPITPIVIVEHSGHNKPSALRVTQESNEAAEKAFEQLQKDGLKDLYLMMFDNDAIRAEGNTVEGVHPNDHGMMIIAQEYEKILRPLLHMEEGNALATKGVTQRRMPQIYDWQERHQQILRDTHQETPRNVIIGNSIIHYWEDGVKIHHGKACWDKYLMPRGYYNMGMAWDRIENILWRVNHGELDGFDAEMVVVEAGSNNTEENNDNEIVDGIVQLLRAVRIHQPKARIKFLAILPCSPDERRIKLLNPKIKKAITKEGFEYCNPGPVLLGKDGRINRNYFVDDAHPNNEGYSLIVENIIK